MRKKIFYGLWAVVVLLSILFMIEAYTLRVKEQALNIKGLNGSETLIETSYKVQEEIKSSENLFSQEKQVSFLAWGDNLLHEPLVDAADAYEGQMRDGAYDFSYLYKDFERDIEQADLSFINQEVISGGDSFGVRGYPHFNVPSDVIKDLDRMGFDLVSLANNHALDMGVQGIQHALKHWKKTNILYHGFFNEQEESTHIPILKRQGLKFAFLSYTTHTNGIKADTPWRVNLLTEDKVIADFKNIPPNIDFIIISVHWGWDNVFEIDEQQKKYAQLFADLGADLVIGTGPHVIQNLAFFDKGQRKNQPSEVFDERDDFWVDKTLVAYSLGNAASAMHGAFNVLEGILKLDFIKQGSLRALSSVRLEPAVMHYDTVQLKAIKVYSLSQYTEDLVNRNVVKFKDNQLSMQYLWNFYEQQVSKKFRISKKEEKD